MKMAIRFVWLFALVFPSIGLCANPFNSLGAADVRSSTQQTAIIDKEVDPERHPLLRWPVEQYVIMGVLLSENTKVAIVRSPAPHSQVYLLRFGDLLGDQDAIVQTIDGNGLGVVQVSLDESPKNLRLDVRNRGIDLGNEGNE